MTTITPAAAVPLPPCDLGQLPTRPAEDRVRKAFADAWEEFFGPSGPGQAFNQAPASEQAKMADEYRDDLPNAENFPTSVAPGIAARAWFACYLERIAKGDKAGADRITDTFR